MKITSTEVNTGGGCMVNIITCDEWNYIMVTNEECVGIYESEDAFWDGEDNLTFAEIKQG